MTARPFTPPIAGQKYDVRNEREFRAMLGRWITARDGRLRSPDGRTWELRVSNTGQLSMVASDGTISTISGGGASGPVTRLDVV